MLPVASTEVASDAADFLACHLWPQHCVWQAVSSLAASHCLQMVSHYQLAKCVCDCVYVLVHCTHDKDSDTSERQGKSQSRCFSKEMHVVCMYMYMYMYLVMTIHDIVYMYISSITSACMYTVYGIEGSPVVCSCVSIHVLQRQDLYMYMHSTCSEQINLFLCTIHVQVHCGLARLCAVRRHTPVHNLCVYIDKCTHSCWVFVVTYKCACCSFDPCLHNYVHVRVHIQRTFIVTV